MAFIVQILLFLRTLLAIYEEPLNNLHLQEEESDNSTKDDSSEELIPVKPNPLRRLQANYEPTRTEPGVSVIEDCGCPGCCTLSPTTVFTTIVLTSTNYCFFTSIATTTTDTTLITTITTTSVLTKTSNLKIVETVTKFTTQTILQQFFTTSTITDSLTRLSTTIEVLTASTLNIIATTSYITGAVTRQIPYFTPYTVYDQTTSITYTAFNIDYDIITETSTVTRYGATLTATLSTTSTNIIFTTFNGPILTSTDVFTQFVTIPGVTFRFTAEFDAPISFYSTTVVTDKFLKSDNT